jgi:hypothetical protein
MHKSSVTSYNMTWDYKRGERHNHESHGLLYGTMGVVTEFHT